MSDNIIAVVDFETYWDSDYTLKKMTTEEYIRDPRFEAILLTVILINITKRKRIRLPTAVGKEQIAALVARIPWHQCAVVAQNCRFDGGILSWRYGVKPKAWICTISMARPNHLEERSLSLDRMLELYPTGRTKGKEVMMARGKHLQDFAPYELHDYISYNIDDTENCADHFFMLLPNLPQTALVEIDMVLRTFIEPLFLLNTHVLQCHYAAIQAKKQKLFAKVAALGDVKSLGSAEKFADLLRARGVEPPMKLSTRKKDENGQPVLTYAFAKKDEGFIELMDHPDEMVQALVAARMGAKSTNAEARAMRLINASHRGPFPMPLTFYQAHTGRLGGADKVNPQNFTKAVALTQEDEFTHVWTPNGPQIAAEIDPKRRYLRTMEGNVYEGDIFDKQCTTLTVRYAIEAPPGYAIVAVDASQIEARIVAWLAECHSLVQGFANGEDVYSDFATSVYGYPCSKATKVERFVGKGCILGLGFGMGHEKLAATLAVPQGGMFVTLQPEEAQRIVRIYRVEKYPEIPKLWKLMERVLNAIMMGEEMCFGPGGVFKTGKDCIIRPNGYKIWYKQLTRDADGFKFWGKKDGRPQWVRIYGGKATENLVQAFASDLIRIAWYKAIRMNPGRFRVGLQVHDEIVGLALKEDAQFVKQAVIQLIRDVPSYAKGLPLDAEGDVALCYGDAK